MRKLTIVLLGLSLLGGPAMFAAAKKAPPHKAVQKDAGAEWGGKTKDPAAAKAAKAKAKTAEQNTHK